MGKPPRSATPAGSCGNSLPPARGPGCLVCAAVLLRRREKDSIITHLSPAQPPDDYKEVTTPYGCFCPRLVMCLRPTLPCHFQTKVNCWELGVGRPPIGVNLSLCRTAYNSSNPEAQAECDCFPCGGSTSNTAQFSTFVFLTCTPSHHPNSTAQISLAWYCTAAKILLT